MSTARANGMTINDVGRSDTIPRPNLIYIEDSSDEEEREPSHRAREKKVMQMPPQLRCHIGRIICKYFDGQRVLGSVEDCDLETEYFKVEFDNGTCIEMKEDEIIRHAATSRHVIGNLQQRDVPRRGERESNERKRLKREKGKYVPLAYAERKEDDYYYYR